MAKRWFGWRRWLLLVAPGAAVLQFGGCGLTDQQLSSIVTSLVSTGLNTLVTQFITAFVNVGAAA